MIRDSSVLWYKKNDESSQGRTSVVKPLSHMN